MSLFWIVLCMSLFCICCQDLTDLNLTKGLFGKAIDHHSLSLWNGRIVVPVASKSDSSHKYNEKNYNICLTSTRKVGLCIRLSECKGFSVSTLYSNICFLDIFSPGVCCDLNMPFIDKVETSSAISQASSSLEDSIPKVQEEFDRGNGTDANDKQSPTNCGIQKISSSFRIVNGNVAEVGKWPWMASVYTNTFLGRKFHCGGSLISAKHVLTGAHCVKDHRGKTFTPRQVSVRLGDSDISTLRDDEESARFFSVKEIRPHPHFQNINHYFLNDVAVIKLNNPATLSNFLFPICLPAPDDASIPLDKFAGRYSTVIGFGRTEIGIQSKKLLEAKVPVWTNKDCDHSYFAPITDIFICAGYKSGGIDACQGDSGGPLQIEEDNRWIQIGVTSFGKGCGEAGFPGVYTRVSKFTKWIKDNMS